MTEPVDVPESSRVHHHPAPRRLLSPCPSPARIIPPVRQSVHMSDEPSGVRTISSRTSPAVNVSPSAFFHDAMPPSVIVGDMAGMAKFVMALRAAEVRSPVTTGQSPALSPTNPTATDVHLWMDDARRAARDAWWRECMLPSAQSPASDDLRVLRACLRACGAQDAPSANAGSHPFRAGIVG